MKWYGEEGDGLTVGIPGVLQPVKQQGELRDFQRSCGRLVFAGFGRRIRK